MSDRRRTGTSNIIDRMVVIRHANETDLVQVEDFLGRYGTAGNLGAAEVVIAAEDKRIIGFGILKKGEDAGCISLFEDSRRRGIGSTIVSHLMEYTPAKKVYATRYASYFSHDGFAKGTNRHAAGKRKIGASCGAPLMERVPIAASKGP